MKLGLFSDAHLEFDWWDYAAAPIPHVFAGDLTSQVTAESRERGRRLAECHPEVVCWVMGNHDFYGGSFPRPGENQGRAGLDDGTAVAWATLWTDLQERYFDTYFARGMADYRYIRDCLFTTYSACHAADLEFLRRQEADVVVTHHGPFEGSVHPKYGDDPFNWCFSSRGVQAKVQKWDKKPRLWVHGHTHEPLDYEVEWDDGQKTRVLCHPRGYKGETGFNGYAPRVIDV
jgi:calcineurin-like phosphoesterase family protein